MQYTLFTPNKKLKYLNKKQVTSPQELLSPEEKHEEKVKGLLEMIDSQFQSMHLHQSNLENQVNFRTEPDELFGEKYHHSQQNRNVQSVDMQSKSALSNLLNLVDTNIIKSQKMNQLGRSKQNGKIEGYQTPKTRRNTKTDQSVDIQNDTEWCSQKMKAQASNTSIQNASVQTKPNKRKKLGFYTYEISYLSPSCKNCRSDKAEGKLDKEQQNESIRAQSNYVNAFKDVIKQESIMNKYFGNKGKKQNKSLSRNEENLDQSKPKIDQNILKCEIAKQNTQISQNFLSPDLISSNQNIPIRVKKQTQMQNIQDVKILKPAQFQDIQNPQKLTKKLLAQPYLKIISKKRNL